MRRKSGKIFIVENILRRPMGANFTICCWYYFLKPKREQKAILSKGSPTAPSSLEQLPVDSSNSDTEEESLFGTEPLKLDFCSNKHSQMSTLIPRNSTSNSRDSAIRRESDRELQAFISMRDKTDKDTEEWEKLNYDIHTLRYAKREVRSRWKKILLQLGYQCEVDALLCVNNQRRYSRDQEQHKKAAELLKHLLDHTSLFPPGTGPRNRYLYVMDYLVSLDSAEEFVRLATEKYPKY